MEERRKLSSRDEERGGEGKASTSKQKVVTVIRGVRKKLGMSGVGFIDNSQKSVIGKQMRLSNYYEIDFNILSEIGNEV